MDISGHQVSKRTYQGLLPPAGMAFVLPREELSIDDWVRGGGHVLPIDSLGKGDFSAAIEVDVMFDWPLLFRVAYVLHALWGLVRHGAAGVGVASIIKGIGARPRLYFKPRELDRG